MMYIKFIEIIGQFSDLIYQISELFMVRNTLPRIRSVLFGFENADHKFEFTLAFT